MKKPEVGQTVYRLPIGNAARRGNVELTPVVVTKVGRKYFTVGEDCQAQQFFIDGWHQNAGEYIADFRCFESPEEWDKERVMSAKTMFIRKFFNSYAKLTEEQINAIYELLAQEGEQE